MSRSRGAGGQKSNGNRGRSGSTAVARVGQFDPSQSNAPKIEWHRFNDEQIEFIKHEITRGLTNLEVKRMFFRKFNMNISESSVSVYRKGMEK